MTTRRHEKLVLTAHHEAAHAFIALHCGAEFERVTATPYDGAAGMLVGLRLAEGQEDDAVRVGLAGIMALRLMSKGWHGWHFDRTRDDFDFAARAVQRMSSGPATLEWCVADNAQILARGWNAVASLAQVLVAQGEVSRIAARTLVMERTQEPRCTPPNSVKNWERVTTRVLHRVEQMQALEAGDPLAIAIENLRRLV